MGKAPNPFSLFDFLGYFFPGAITVYSFIIAYAHVSHKYQAADAVKEIFALNDWQNLLPFVLAAYVLGHFLSYVSSITIEKYLYWQYGFPSKFLLNLPFTPYFPRRIRFGFVDAGRLVLIVFLLPIFLLDQLCRVLSLSGFYAKALDPLTREIVGRKTMQILSTVAGVKPEKEKHGSPTTADFFMFLYHYALENAPQHGPKMQNYVALYGFLRTITLIALSYFWIGAWHLYYSGAALNFAAATLGGLAVAVFVFFLAYFKFLRRYSLEVFMAAAVAYSDPRSDADRQSDSSK